jgi:hypothetical protein
LSPFDELPLQFWLVLAIAGVMLVLSILFLRYS